jgi:hypothetical protein
VRKGSNYGHKNKSHSTGVSSDIKEGHFCTF